MKQQHSTFIILLFLCLCLPGLVHSKKHKVDATVPVKLIRLHNNDIKRHINSYNYSDFYDKYKKSAVKIICLRQINLNKSLKNRFPNLKFPNILKAKKTEFIPVGGGSGFFYKDSQTVLTNSHVISKCDKVSIITYDKTTYPANVIAHDSKIDIAFLKVKAKSYLPLQIAEQKLKPGHRIFTIGNPYGLEGSFADGVVSSVHRFNIPNVRDHSIFLGLHQTTLPINPGNSGSPIFDVNGQVAAIAVAILPHAQNIAFLIPSERITISEPYLSKGKAVPWSFLGIKTQIRKRKNPNKDSFVKLYGIYISALLKDSPASKTLKSGDQITHYDQIAIKSVRHLKWLIAKSFIKTFVIVDIVREGKPLTVVVKAEELNYFFRGKSELLKMKDIKEYY